MEHGAPKKTWLSKGVYAPGPSLASESVFRLADFLHVFAGQEFMPKLGNAFEQQACHNCSVTKSCCGTLRFESN